MQETILEMQESLDDKHFIAFISANENPQSVALKSDELKFPDNKTLVIRKKGGITKIINLNLIIEICIRRFGQYA
ncbi:hypothetical protein [Methanobrevibacter sp.]|uniref:hypothetical protein n=1 Tax=Methanobrevibacter sp. TaxID=66852 RepID=UPI00388F69A9